MNTVKVSLGIKSYTIHFETGLRQNLCQLLKPFAGSGKVLILSDENIRRLYPLIFKEFKKSNVEMFFIKPGENSKRFETVENIIGFMLKKGFDRSSLLVALGGGVVGDIGGFAASIYMRGIQYVQVPTTLLSQVDSSVGGKTGVNHTLGKNMIGTFYQPKAVFIDTGFLKTLNEREFLNGFAEVIKHGIIRSEKLFTFLETNLNEIINRNQVFLDKIVIENCRIKSDVVSKDEKEKNLRAILNFGHTFGHAVETLTGYRTYSHGEALLLGMKAAIKTASNLKMIRAKDADRLLMFLAAIPFPAPTKLVPEKVYNIMFRDKKTCARKLRLILPEGIGKVKIINNPAKAAVMSGIRAMNY